MGILANESLTKVLWNEYVIFEVSRCVGDYYQVRLRQQVTRADKLLGVNYVSPHSELEVAGTRHDRGPYTEYASVDNQFSHVIYSRCILCHAHTAPLLFATIL